MVYVAAKFKMVLSLHKVFVSLLVSSSVLYLEINCQSQSNNCDIDALFFSKADRFFVCGNQYTYYGAYSYYD